MSAGNLAPLNEFTLGRGAAHSALFHVRGRLGSVSRPCGVSTRPPACALCFEAFGGLGSQPSLGSETPGDVSRASPPIRSAEICAGPGRGVRLKRLRGRNPQCPSRLPAAHRRKIHRETHTCGQAHALTQPTSDPGFRGGADYTRKLGGEQAGARRRREFFCAPHEKSSALCRRTARRRGRLVGKPDHML
jgi:hypothetical protein